MIKVVICDDQAIIRDGLDGDAPEMILNMGINWHFRKSENVTNVTCALGQNFRVFTN